MKYIIRHCQEWLPGMMEYLETREDYSMDNGYRWVIVHGDRSECKVGSIRTPGLDSFSESQIVGQISETQFNALYTLYYRRAEL